MGLQSPIVSLKFVTLIYLTQHMITVYASFSTTEKYTAKAKITCGTDPVARPRLKYQEMEHRQPSSVSPGP